MPKIQLKKNLTHMPQNKLSICLILALTFFLICLLVLTNSDGLLLYITVQTEEAA